MSESKTYKCVLCELSIYTVVLQTDEDCKLRHYCVNCFNFRSMILSFTTKKNYLAILLSMQLRAKLGLSQSKFDRTAKINECTKCYHELVGRKCCSCDHINQKLLDMLEDGNRCAAALWSVLILDHKDAFGKKFTDLVKR